MEILGGGSRKTKNLSSQGRVWIFSWTTDYHFCAKLGVKAGKWNVQHGEWKTLMEKKSAECVFSFIVVFIRNNCTLKNYKIIWGFRSLESLERGPRKGDSAVVYKFPIG